MAAGTRCELTDLIVDQCAHCRGIGDDMPDDPLRDPAPPTPERRSAFPAAYEGQCWVCTQGIETGDLITRYLGGYVHQECADE